MVSHELSCEAGSFCCCLNRHRFFQSEALRLYFPALEPWVDWSVSLLSCSSWFICIQMWICLLHQLPPCPPRSFWHCLVESPLYPGCLSLPLLPVWVSVSSLTPWLSDFHTVRLSGSCGYFLFLNLLSFFWLCKEVKCIYLGLHLGWNTVCQFLINLNLHLT